MNTEINYEARKAEIIADSSKFQRVCSQFVSRNVEHCMSSLFYDIGQNLEQCAKIFDFDYDEAMAWFSSEDWEQPVRSYIFDDADLDDLERIVGLCDEDWDDILDGIGYKVYVATCEEEDDDPDDFEDWLKGQDECHDDADSFTTQVRDAVWMMVTGDYYETVGREFNLDPDQREVYEHWLITRDLGTLLQFHNETVFEFANMTIWGRTTSGQLISIDSVIEQIVKGFDCDSWVWGEG